MRNNNISLPANCAALSENEMMYVGGGFAAETAGKAIIAVGGAVALTAVAAVAAAGILSIFNPSGWGDIISSSIENGQKFIDTSVAAGQDLLNKLMGK